MTFYFSNTADQDPTNVNNWWDDIGGTGTNGNTPSGGDDCIIESSQTCSTSNFSYNSLTVDGTLTLNETGKTVLTVGASGVVTDNYQLITTNNGTVVTNSSTGTVTDNYGTVTSNVPGATVSYNYGIVSTNNGSISNRPSGGSTTIEYEAVSIQGGYTVFHLYASDSNIINNGTITNLHGTIGPNYGIVTDVISTGTIVLNASIVTSNHGTINFNSSGTVVDNYASIYENSGTVTTNHSLGTVHDNNFGGIITNQNGTVRIGTITGGTGNLAAAAATNLASHTAGANVTLPSGNTTWW
jgi:hypothetical protein